MAKTKKKDSSFEAKLLAKHCNGCPEPDAYDSMCDCCQVMFDIRRAHGFTVFPRLADSDTR